MSNFIKTQFDELNLHATPELARKIIDLVIRYEMKRMNPLTLNSRLMGVHPMYFLPEDRANLFHLFSIEEKDFLKVMRKLPHSVMPFERKVWSDPFNNFCIWVTHLLETQLPTVEHKLKYDAQVAVLKYLNYKYFTSIVNRFYPVGAEEATMFYVVNQLSNKFDIVRENNWKAVITKRAEDMISEQSIHLQTFRTATPDSKFSYIITDTQSRMKDKIKIISTEYYTAKEHGNKIGTVNATMTDSEGDKILVQQSTTISSTRGKLIRDLYNENAWVDLRLTRFIAAQFPQINQTLLKNALTEQTNLATVQSKSHKMKETEVVHGKVIILDQRKLIELVVSTSVRFCAKKGIDFKKKQLAWQSLRNMFSSSRTLDTDVLTIKNSFEHFVESLGASSRESTKSSLKVAMILYVIYRVILAL